MRAHRRSSNNPSPGLGLRGLFLALTALWTAFLPTPAPLLAAEPAQPLRLAFIERPPFYTNRDGVPAGFLLEAASKVFAAAGVPVVLVPSTTEQILEDIQRIDGHTCSPGWYKTMEREAFARFSIPLYRNSPLVALALRSNASRFLPRKSLQALAADKNLRLGIIEGYSYGEALDRQIRAFMPQRVEVAADQRLMLQMLRKNAFDYLLVAPEEIENLMRDAGVPPEDFLIHALTDAPVGDPGHIMCSRDVDLSAIDLLNDAINALGQARWP
jgi:polar amino acid transport system substrate-binding protein